MKYINLILILVLFSCEKKDLPEPTQTGKNTFGMLVNGVKWLPYLAESTPIEGSPINLYYDKSRCLLFIHATNQKNKEQIFLYAHGIARIGNYLFSYRNDISLDSLFTCADSTRFEMNNNCSNSYNLKDSLQSVLILTKLDTVNKIVSGTFSLKLYNSLGTTVDITDGRFDVAY